MNDLVIACSSGYDWEVLKYWCNSLNRSGYTGKKVVIVISGTKDTLTKLIDNGFEVIVNGLDQDGNPTSTETHLPPHVERFVHIYDYLSKNKFRYVVTTDIRDVIFQKNPIDWIEQNIEDKQFVFSSESMLYKDEPWGDRNLLETFGAYFYEKYKNNEIFNVGVLAGKGDSITSLCANIFVSCINKPIPICDQSTFNFLISQEPYLSVGKYTRSEDGWACQLGTTADPNKINHFRPFLLEQSPKINQDKVVTSTGIEYNIVHQYDRVPEWNEILTNRYR